MSVLLPVRQEGPHFRFFSELEGVSYSFEFRWNEREEAWFLTLGDGEGVPLVAGLRVVVDFDLLSYARGERVPSGYLFALDTQGEHIDPGFEDLGRRVQMHYFTADELT